MEFVSVVNTKLSCDIPGNDLEPVILLFISIFDVELSGGRVVTGFRIRWVSPQ